MVNPKIDTYRIVDGLYRIDAGLYELVDAVGKNTSYTLRATRHQIVGPGAIFLLAILASIPLVVTIGGVEWVSSPTIVIAAIALVHAGVMVWRLILAGKEINRFDKLVSSARPKELQSQHDYSMDQVSEWGTRLSLAVEILEENERLHSSSVIDESEYRQCKRKFENQKSYCVDRLREIESLNDEFHSDGQRTEREYRKVKEWLDDYRRFLDGPSK